MKTLQIHYDDSMQEHLMWLLNSLPNVVVEKKEAPAKPRTRETDKLAGCLSKYAKGKENISIKEARDIAWGAVVKEKHDSGRY